jgi:integrase
MGAKELRAQMVAGQRVQSIEGETEKGRKMIYKRGRVYWYKFVWDGQSIRKSTRQGNDKVARQMEAAHRTSLAKGEVGIREKKKIPTLGEFCTSRLEPWAKSTFLATVPKNFAWFHDNVKVICNAARLASLRMDNITNEAVSEFAAGRLRQGYAVSTINSTIRVTRRALSLAKEWGVIDSIPTLNLISGENHREHVVTPQEEQAYLEAADPELAAFMILEFDTGLRPDEAYSLRWEHVNWNNGNNGSVFVAQGKTSAARRVVPMTPRLKFLLEARWELAGSPAEGWVWPAPTKSGRYEQSTLTKRHRKALAAAKVGNVEIRPFVIYSVRHTFLTRLGESGCDAWTLARIAGHSAIAMSMRYVHPSQAAVERAMTQLSGHNSRHSPKLAVSEKTENTPQNNELRSDAWWAVRDSNPRLPACKAGALTN